ncbi:DUF502 domain-containing protein [Candidatus Liberibacter sp.]|uniref:DUF502 domain-containing protein n=1 Tax=Candidatus Liberibacter sp. TaxID=34022 RepID=UPI0015F5AA0F|nr:DUF502 domain-containing protein [Candidatus Liberibacter sp.]MBA5724000.1 DUF502 domain-containing protein [Candidatus Liberibacter sp.]
MQNKTIYSSLVMKVRSNFLTGFIICAPVLITIWLTLSLINWIDGFITPYIPMRYNPEYYFNFAIPGLGLLIAVIFISIVGFAAKNLIGRYVVFLSESILNHTPVVRGLYKSTKQIVQTILKENAVSFKRPCLIEYPSPGIWSLCFLTTDVQGELKEKFSEKGQDDMVTVFIPPTPLPTAGMLVFTSRSKIIMLDMTAEDSAKMLISGGLIIPEYTTKDDKTSECQ